MSPKTSLLCCLVYLSFGWLLGNVNALPASPVPSLSRLESRGKASVITSCTKPNTVALTFDDGPYIWLNDVVDTLKKAGAKGTFFFNGNNWDCIYDDASIKRIKYAYDNGFQVASHTWSHKDLTTLQRDAINTEMAMTEQAIKRITGAQVAFTRTPYGTSNDLLLDVATSRAQNIIKWDFDSGDSVGNTVDQQKKLYDDAVAKHPKTILSLQHEVHDSSVHQVLPYAIQKLQAAGYKLVTVAECLGMQPYISTGKPAVKDATWKC